MSSDLTDSTLSREDLLRLLAEKESEIRDLRQENQKIQFKYKRLLSEMYGPRSEKLSVINARSNSEEKNDPQFYLFNEIEQGSTLPGDESDSAADGTKPAEALPAKKSRVKAHERSSRGRKPLPEHLPRQIITHELPPEEQFCSKGHPLEKFGEDASERVFTIPQQYYVERHIRFKIAARPVPAKRRKRATRATATQQHSPNRPAMSRR